MMYLLVPGTEQAIIAAMVENNVNFFYLALVYAIPLAIGGLAAIGLTTFFVWHFRRRAEPKLVCSEWLIPLFLVPVAIICFGYVVDDFASVVRPFVKTAKKMCEAAQASSSVRKSLSAPPKRVASVVTVSNCVSCYLDELAEYPETTFVLTGFARADRRWEARQQSKFKFTPSYSDVELSLGEISDQACFYPLDYLDRNMEAFVGRCVIMRPKTDAPVDVLVMTSYKSTTSGNMKVARSLLTAMSGGGELLYYGEDLYIDGDGSIVLELRHIFGGITNYSCRHGGIPAINAALRAISPKTESEKRQ